MMFSTEGTKNPTWWQEITALTVIFIIVFGNLMFAYIAYDGIITGNWIAALPIIGAILIEAAGLMILIG